MARTRKSERLYQAKRQDLQNRIKNLQDEIARLEARENEAIVEVCRYCLDCHSSISHFNDKKGV